MKTEDSHFDEIFQSVARKGKSRQGFIYRSFRAYLRFVHERFFYRNVYRVGKENIPPDGVPVLIVSNHQNCLNDPLGVLFTFKDRKLNILTRADVFAVHPAISFLLRKMGLLPAYRLNFEGEDALGKNKEIFYVLEKELISGRTILMYPEGMHQDKHWLGDFSLSYARMAFEAAERDDFQTEIFILPCCNHYSEYYDIQKDVLIKFGTPVSIKPYYELYRTRPRTAQRQVNAVIREQIIGMMLHATDLDNYEAIDFLRNTYGRKYAEDHGFKVACLPDKLQSDQIFLKKLEEAKVENASSIQQIFDDALKLEDELKRLKIRDDNFVNTSGRSAIIMSVIVIVVLFPVWLFSLWPNLFIYKAPVLVMRRVKDKMFHNSFLFGISVLITMPALYTLSFILAWVYANGWFAFIYAPALPWLGLFAWYYWKYAVRTWQNAHFCRVSATTAGRKVRDLRNSVYERLNNILNKYE
ncbi:MAG: 1-acyl-sn-glycerol-3-phosphate acyltransferase [Tannerella sp.]|jgi:1-acyl-sn-glycerol-3-phosphate acyltransferase|nr:1-acyl-sn-glycerol-3-phosphate acyltransferase [Tannerella sp.]